MDTELERLDAQIEILEKLLRESKGFVAISRGFLVDEMQTLLRQMSKLENAK